MIPVYAVANLSQPLSSSICRPHKKIHHKIHHKLVYTLYLHQLTNRTNLLASYMFADNSKCKCYSQCWEHRTLCKHFIRWRGTMLVHNNTISLRIPTTSKQVALSSFGAKLQSYQKLGVAFIQVKTNMGEVLPANVVIVPSIAAPIWNSFCVAIDSVTHILWSIEPAAAYYYWSKLSGFYANRNRSLLVICTRSH